MERSDDVRSRTLVLRGIAVAAALALAFAALGGCIPIAPTPDGGTTIQGGANEVEPPVSEEATRIVEMVEVPDVLGLYYVEAAEAIEAAGLDPVDVSVHGPVDEDAGEIGKVYRQTPKAGERVTTGSKVELRTWWESQ